jgi:hypothetical protein
MRFYKRSKYKPMIYLNAHFSYKCNFCTHGHAGVELIELNQSIYAKSYFIEAKIQHKITEMDLLKNNIFKRKSTKLKDFLNNSFNNKELKIKVKNCIHGCYECFVVGQNLQTKLKDNSFDDQDDNEIKIDLTKDSFSFEDFES